MEVGLVEVDLVGVAGNTAVKAIDRLIFTYMRPIYQVNIRSTFTFAFHLLL